MNLASKEYNTRIRILDQAEHRGYMLPSQFSYYVGESSHYIKSLLLNLVNGELIGTKEIPEEVSHLKNEYDDLLYGPIS